MQKNKTAQIKVQRFDSTSPERWDASFQVISSEKGNILIDPGKWTMGGMANHTWSFAGPGTEGDKGYFSKTLVQPFITYQLPKGWSVGFNSESIYDWKENEWLVPLTLQVSKVAKIGDMPISFALAPNYYLERPDSGPRWGARAIVTLVF